MNLPFLLPGKVTKEILVLGVVKRETAELWIDSEQFNIWLRQFRISHANRSRNLRNLYLNACKKIMIELKKTNKTLLKRP